MSEELIPSKKSYKNIPKFKNDVVDYYVYIFSTIHISVYYAIVLLSLKQPISKTYGNIEPTTL